MFEIAVIWGSFFSAGALFSIWEHRNPARPVEYRRRVWRDLGAFATVFVFFLAVGALVQVLTPLLLPPSLIAAIKATKFYDSPVWIRLILFYLVWDCSMYWVHRFMHQRFVWTIHKWHHAPTDLYWFVGVRGSFGHIIITYLPFLWFWIFGLPAWIAIPVSVGSVIGNAWMHVNVTGRWMRWVELVFVTPRFHVIHHSDNPEHYKHNLGSLFSFWDRLFGTYLDPEIVDPKRIKFGIGEPVHPVRLAIGM
jgi:sterol desaturase/sphingolipid hydroxylase (fatty acid hydroxylase superfamily)